MHVHRKLLYNIQTENVTCLSLVGEWAWKVYMYTGESSIVLHSYD